MCRISFARLLTTYFQPTWRTVPGAQSCDFRHRSNGVVSIRFRLGEPRAGALEPSWERASGPVLCRTPWAVSVDRPRTRDFRMKSAWRKKNWQATSGLWWLALCLYCVCCSSSRTAAVTMMRKRMLFSWFSKLCFRHCFHNYILPCDDGAFL